MDYIGINQGAQDAVAAYIEYENIVGGRDGGKLMAPEEYEEFKREVAAKRANRLFVYWVNADGLECKTIGPHSKCFCNHRYKDHASDNVKTKKVNCEVPKCRCPKFNYIPIHGSQDLKCLCKHSYRDHDPRTKKCLKCKNCSGFTSKHSCSCGMHYDQHATMFYTKAEREAMGKPVDNVGFGGEMFAGMGGITGMSDLVDGVERMRFDNALPGEEIPALTGASRRAIEAPQKPAPRQQRGAQSDVNALALFMTPHSLN